MHFEDTFLLGMQVLVKAYETSVEREKRIPPKY